METIQPERILSSDYLSALLGSMEEAVIATDEEFIIRYWNKGAEALFGIKSGEAIGERGRNILNLKYTNDTIETAREGLLQTGAWKGIVEFEKAPNVVLTLSSSVTVAKDSLGKLIGYVGVHRDITDYTETKANLETFLSVISSIEDNFLVVDKNSELVFIDNKREKDLQEIYGMKLKVGDNVMDNFPAQRQKNVKEALDKAFNGEKNDYQVNLMPVIGKNIWLEAHYFPVKNKTGEISHVCILVKDITDQKELDKIKERLYKSRLLFEIFMENSPMPAWITDSKGFIRYLNPSYLRTYHLDKKVIDQHITNVFQEDSSKMFLDNDAIVYQTQKTLQFIESSITPDEQEHIYQVVKFPIRDNGNFYIGGWAIDITQEIALQDSLTKSLHQLQTSEKELKQALAKEHYLNDLKSRFVSMASHEFRTPLSSMLSSCFLIEKYTAEDQLEQRHKHVHRIKEGIHHMNALLEDFLSLGKLEDGKTTIAISELDLPELVHSILEELEPISKEGQKILFSHAGKSLIHSDKKLLRNIILNLLSNSIKFSDKNKTIQLNISAIDGEIKIVVKDQGIGISQEDQRHLFETFFRGRNALNIQGTGLGLHIIKRYADLLNGTITIQSELGSGTTVTVTIHEK